MNAEDGDDLNLRVAKAWHGHEEDNVTTVVEAATVAAVEHKTGVRIQYYRAEMPRESMFPDCIVPSGTILVHPY
jgi:hypothetical protein